MLRASVRGFLEGDGQKADSVTDNIKASSGFNPLAKTHRERSAHQEAVEKMRLEHISKSEQLFMNAIGVQIEAAAKAVERGGDFLGPVSAESFGVERAMKDTWLDVALRFAGETFNVMEAATKDFTDAQVETWTASVNEYLATEGAEKVVLIDDTTREWLRSLMSEAVNEGWGADRAAREIRLRWKDIEKFRAERIARTEINSAQSFGTRESALESGLDLRKVWITALDGRERSSHGAANGQKRDMDKPYSVNGFRMMHPHDGTLGAPAKEIVNCRCAEAYEVIE